MARASRFSVFHQQHGMKKRESCNTSTRKVSHGGSSSRGSNKARYGTNKFNSMEKQSQYLSNFLERKIWAGKSIDFLGFDGLGLTERFGAMM